VLRHPDWHRASVLWSALALVAACAPVLLLVVWTSRGPPVEWQPAGVALLGGAVLGAAAAVLLRRTQWRYRATLVVSAGCLCALVVGGGLFVGVYFLPAAILSLLAAGSEALSRRAT
jgi:hypothetical protein